MQTQSKKWDAQLEFTLQDTLKEEVALENAPYKNRIKYTCTILNQNGLTCDFMCGLVDLFLVLKISVEKMIKLSVGGFTSAEFKVSIEPEVDLKEFRMSLFELGKMNGTDVALQKCGVFRKNKRFKLLYTFIYIFMFILFSFP